MQLYDIPEYSLDELYDYYNRTIDLAASYDWAVHPRTQFHVQSALRDYRKFADGELDIDLGTKRWFRVMSHLVEEVGDLDDNQTALVLALAEIGHAAAHLGHLNTALSRGGRTEADVKYEELRGNLSEPDSKTLTDDAPPPMPARKRNTCFRAGRFSGVQAAFAGARKAACTPACVKIHE